MGINWVVMYETKITDMPKKLLIITTTVNGFVPNKRRSVVNLKRITIKAII